MSDDLTLAEVVGTSRAVAATRSRTAKTAELTALLSRTPPALVEIVTAWLSGVLPQGRIGVGYRSLAALPSPADDPTLTVSGVHAALTGIAGVAGAGSAARRRDALETLFSAATEHEQTWLRSLLTGEVRQGALDGVMLPAVAAAAQVPEAQVRRALMLAGHLAPVAGAALLAGPGDAAAQALEAVHLEVGRPLRPMLAGAAPDVAEALAGMTGRGGVAAVVEAKLDGIRVQVHRSGDDVRVFTRSLDDITPRLPEVVELALALDTHQLVLDGETIALDPDGRPLPFQVTGARTASRGNVDELRERTPLSTFCFDLLHLDGRDLVDEPLASRRSLLHDLLHRSGHPEALVLSRETTEPGRAAEFFAEIVSAGHEGVVIKDLASPYAAGRRGSGWVKVKPRHTFDLVVLAVEWGSGRREGLLSNIHLGARDPDTGELVMVGKTFKGMTDEMLAWQTERFLGLETHREGHVVHVRPEQVVEVAIDGVQTSRRYPGGLALRFARVIRYRDDKGAAEADTLDSLRTLG